MSNNKHHVGDIGTPILVDVGEDISGATEQKLYVQKPSGRLEVWTATVEGTNFLKHVTVASDWNEAGKYYLHSWVKLPAWQGFGERAEFTIYAQFE